MRFELELPWGERLVYGIDAAPLIQWFGELVDQRGRVVASYGAGTRGYDNEKPLRALLVWLGDKSTLFSEADLDEVLELLIHETPQDLPHELRVVGEIVCDLQAAARFG